LIIQEPKSGREGEVAYLPRKLLQRLNEYVKDNKINRFERIFPISYVLCRCLVYGEKSGRNG
jgi:hypothetical protein